MKAITLLLHGWELGAVLLIVGWQHLLRGLPVCCLEVASAVQAMLDHTLLPAAERLEGPYQQAFNRICNQV